MRAEVSVVVSVVSWDVIIDVVDVVENGVLCVGDVSVWGV